MIIGIVGGVGSGKSVLATKKILESKNLCFVNYDIKCKNTKRLKKEDIVHEEVTEYTKTGKPKTETKINWKFWNDALKKHGNYHLFLDEFHNIAHSRQSQTKWNTMMSMWISQIRKVLGASETTHIYLVSQRLKRIDVAFRDLMHLLIYCQKVQCKPFVDTYVIEDGKKVIKKLPITWVLNYYFSGEDLEYDYSSFLAGNKSYKYRSGFIANPYFQYYDSYQLFGETAYL